MESVDDISKMFTAESDKLENLINAAESKSGLSIHEIVETYYQVMNASSMATMLKQRIGTEHQSFLDQIQETERLISGKFNTVIHPKIIENLTASIQETTKQLRANTGEKSKEQAESEADQYGELRKKMSTKEFVEQYGKGISND